MTEEDLHLYAAAAHSALDQLETLFGTMQEALEAALPDLHILDSRLQDETEAAGNKYYGLRSVRLVEAALEKVGER